MLWVRNDKETVSIHWAVLSSMDMSEILKASVYKFYGIWW